MRFGPRSASLDFLGKITLSSASFSGGPDVDVSAFRVLVPLLSVVDKEIACLSKKL